MTWWQWLIAGLYPLTFLVIGLGVAFFTGRSKSKRQNDESPRPSNP